MRTQRVADLAIAMALVTIATLALIGAFQIKAAAGERLQSRTFPLLMGAVLMVTGGALGFTAWRSRSVAEVQWPDRVGFRRIGVVLGSLMIYLVIIEPVGFPISSFFFISLLVWYFGRYRWYLCGLIGLTSAVVLYFVFMQFLGLSLPAGLLQR